MYYFHRSEIVFIQSKWILHMYTSVFNILGKHVLVISTLICLFKSKDCEVNTLVLNFMQNLYDMQ